MIPVKYSYLNRGLRNETSIYQNAFLNDFTTIWGDSQFSDEIEDFCYSRAHACFIRDNVIGETQRRELLHSYMSYNFASDKETDSINKDFGSMASDNLYVMRTLKNLCIAYNEAPIRDYGSYNKTAAEQFENILLEAQFNTVLNKAYRIQKLINEVMIMPVFTTINGRKRLSLRYYTPDLYAVLYDSLGDIMELWIPYFEPQKNGMNETKYLVVDKERYVTKDAKFDNIPFVYNGNQVTEVIHPYGRVPAVVLSLSGITDYNTNKSIYGGGMYELIKAQLDCNQLDTCIKQNYIYSGFAQWLYINFNETFQNVIMGPGRPIALNQVQDIEGANVPPQIEIQSPPDHYTPLEELKKSRMRNVMRNYGLPTSLLDDNPSIAASGVAMRVDRMELEEVRREDLPILKQNEKDLIELIRLVINLDDASDYKGKYNEEFKEINIDYKETSRFIEPLEEFNYYTQIYDKNLIEPKEYVKMFSGNDNIATNEDAIEYVNKIKEYKSLMGDAQNAEPVYEGAGIGSASDNERDEQAGDVEPPEGTAGEARTADN